MFLFEQWPNQVILPSVPDAEGLEQTWTVPVRVTAEWSWDLGEFFYSSVRDIRITDS